MKQTSFLLPTILLLLTGLSAAHAQSKYMTRTGHGHVLLGHPD